MHEGRDLCPLKVRREGNPDKVRGWGGQNTGGGTRRKSGLREGGVRPQKAGPSKRGGTNAPWRWGESGVEAWVGIGGGSRTQEAGPRRCRDPRRRSGTNP